MRRSSSAANRRRSAGRITSPMRPVAPPITSKGYHTCRGWELNAAATPTSAKQAPTLIIPTNRPSTRPRALPRPPSTPMIAPTTPTRLPITVVVANLAGDDVARTRDLRVIDGDGMKGRRARGRGTELERRRGTRSLAGPHHTRGHDRPRPVDRHVLCGHRTGGYQEHYSGASEHASHVDPPAPCDELPGACGTSRR